MPSQRKPIHEMSELEFEAECRAKNDEIRAVFSDIELSRRVMAELFQDSPEVKAFIDPEYPDAVANRQLAMALRESAEQLERNAGVWSSSGLTAIARLMHAIAAVRTPLADSVGIDWNVVVQRGGLDCTPDQARSMWEVVSLVGTLAGGGSPEGDWEKLAAAHAAMSVDGVGPKRRAVLAEVSRAVRLLRGDPVVPCELGERLSARGIDLQDVLLDQLRDRLAEIDPAFLGLETQFIQKQVNRASPTEQVRKGGAGNIAPAMVAARLAVRVGAFGDNDVRRSKSRFLAAEQSAER